MSFVPLPLRAHPGYDLSHVDGIESFAGSSQAQDILGKQGFVVAAPDFKQIFEPYIKSPLPVIITVDSAWHTYHFLLEQGVKEMERGQAAKLLAFSRLLRAECLAQASGGSPEFAKLAEFAAIGLAFQDTPSATNLNEGQMRILNALISGEGTVQADIGLPLSALSFRPQSFYTQSEELKRYYRARQWYASVDFRLSNDGETRLALCLTWLAGYYY